MAGRVRDATLVDDVDNDDDEDIDNEATTAVALAPVGADSHINAAVLFDCLFFVFCFFSNHVFFIFSTLECIDDRAVWRADASRCTLA